MSVPLTELLLSQTPEAERIGTPEVLVDPALPHVPGDQHAAATATALDLAVDVLACRGALPSQHLERRALRRDAWGACYRVLCAPSLAGVRMLALAALAAAALLLSGGGPVQAATATALGAVLSVSVDSWRRDRLDRADQDAVEAEARRLLRRAGLGEVWHAPTV